MNKIEEDIDDIKAELKTSILPDQRGNAGKFLKTDGKNLSWSNTTSSNMMPVSYMIFKDGLTVNAMNGNTGTVDYSGSNIVTVANDIVSTMSSNNMGGVIFTKAGTYPVNSNLNMANNFVFLGEGGSTQFIISGSGRIVMNDVNNVTIRNILINGSNSTISEPGLSGSLAILNSSNINIDNIIIKDANLFGISVFTSNGVIIQNSYMNGLGNNDVIGGDGDNAAYTLSDVIIKNNIIKQAPNIVGASAINMVSVYRAEFVDNTTYGNIIFGGEKYPNLYSIISRNIVKKPDPTSSTSFANISIMTTPTATVQDQSVTVCDNIIENGYLHVLGQPTQPLVYGKIDNNVINGANYGYSSLNLYYGTKCTITNNTIIGGNTGINLGNSTYSNIMGNIIDGSNTGILENANSGNNFIVNNYLQNVKTPVSGITATTKIFNNRGIDI